MPQVNEFSWKLGSFISCLTLFFLYTSLYYMSPCPGKMCSKLYYFKFNITF